MALQLNEFFSPVWLSLKIALLATIVVVLCGTLVAKFLLRKSFKGKFIIEAIIVLPMVLPPTVVGFLLLLIFGKNSVIGQAIEWLFGQPIIFTWWAAVVAAIAVSFPLMYNAAKAGFLSVDQTVEEAARIEGASEWQVLRKITVPLAMNNLIVGAILTFARALGEFGATLMFAGNIPNKTQTIPTAIYVAMTANKMTLAWLWVIAIILLSFIMLFIVQRKEKTIN